MITFSPRQRRVGPALILVAIVILLSATAFYFGTRVSQPPTIPSDNALLSIDQINAVPVGTKVWIQYNHDRLDLWGDEAAVTYEKTGVGLVLRCANGYWELDDVGFGTKWRVWEHPPTEQEQNSIRWEDSPWN